MRIFLTGATGSLGHYLADELLEHSSHELVVFARDPSRLHVAMDHRLRVSFHRADLRDRVSLGDVPGPLDAAVLAATAWGPEPDATAVNIEATMALIDALVARGCRRIIYFSTASVLDRGGAPLREAATIGTPYIRSKYACLEAVQRHDAGASIVTVFPTLVLAGDSTKPSSHVTKLIEEIRRRVVMARHFRAHGSFHLIHAADVAQVVRHLLDADRSPAPDGPLVLGSAATTVDEAIDALCAGAGRTRSRFTLDITPRVAGALIVAFRARLAEWDRYCLAQRDFTYDRVVSPETFGLRSRYPTLASLLASVPS
jgi:nucleoside-diphosphate-sugar epimerase